MTVRQFTMAEAAVLAGTTPGALRQQLHRGVIWFDEEKDTPSPGVALPRMISDDTLFKLVITSRLADAGVATEKGFGLATRFIDAGDFAVDGNNDVRGPGEFYKEGSTCILYRGDGTEEIVNVKPDTPAGVFFGSGLPTLLLDLNSARRELDAAIQELDQAKKVG